MPVKYQNGKIYKIECNITNEIYIGSTCQPTLARRLTGHVDRYKQVKKGAHCSRLSSYNIIERGDYNIYLIENFPCDNKDELTKREGELIKQMKNDETVVNITIPGRTKAEYRIDNKDKINADKKKYRENNKDKTKEYSKNNKEKINATAKKYSEANQEKNKAYKKVQYTCECGSTICLVKKSSHIKTKKHIKFVESKNEPAN